MVKNLFICSIFVIAIAMIIYYVYPEKKLPSGVTIDKMVVFKSKRELLVYSKGRLVKTYTISLAKNPVGHKQYEGDYRTPEGYYTINSKNPKSVCYKNLGISYPDKEDISAAKNLGKTPGGNIKIHGILNGFGFIGKFHRWGAWTAGCIALTNEEMDELYYHTPVGTPIEIKP
jgi:murein L,D-transpeptidase YafK